MALISLYRSRDYTSNGRSAFSSSIGEELLLYSLARSLSGLYFPPGILCPNSNRNSLTERGENCIFRVSHNSDIKELSVQPCEQTSSPVSKSFHSLDCFSAQFGKKKRLLLRFDTKLFQSFVQFDPPCTKEVGWRLKLFQGCAFDIW